MTPDPDPLAETRQTLISELEDKITELRTQIVVTHIRGALRVREARRRALVVGFALGFAVCALLGPILGWR